MSCKNEQYSPTSKSAQEIETVFDLGEAQRLVEAEWRNAEPSHRSIILDQYSRYTVEGLEYLVEQVPEAFQISLGFQHLCENAAILLGKMSVDIVYLECLDTLQPDVARLLWWPPEKSPILCIGVRSELSEGTAIALMSPPVTDGDNSRKLSLRMPTLNIAVAGILTRHTGELDLELTDGDLMPEVAKVLASHNGYHLSVHLPRPSGRHLIEAFQSNAEKKVVTRRSEVLILDRELPFESVSMV